MLIARMSSRHFFETGMVYALRTSGRTPRPSPAISAGSMASPLFTRRGPTRAHHKCISAGGREMPCLARCGDVSNAPVPRELKRMCRAAVPCEMAWGVATRKRDTGAKVRPIKEESGRDAMRMAASYPSSRHASRSHANLLSQRDNVPEIRDVWEPRERARRTSAP
jgi:hypothetical protein